MSYKCMLNLRVSARELNKYLVSKGSEGRNAKGVEGECGSWLANGSTGVFSFFFNQVSPVDSLCYIMYEHAVAKPCLLFGKVVV